jgi:hypothetical protein
MLSRRVGTTINPNASLNVLRARSRTAMLPCLPIAPNRGLIPPYNVKVEPRSNDAIAAGNSSFPEAKKRTHHQSFDVARQGEKKPTTKKLRAKDRQLANDFLPEAEFDRLLRAWFGNLARVLLPGRGFYVWGGYANLGNYPPALKECELYFSQGIVWDKQHPVLTRKDFMGCFELAFYGWREGAAHEFWTEQCPGSLARQEAKHGSFDREARRIGRAGDPVLVADWRERARPVRRLWEYADRRPADGPQSVPDGA